ncbi:ispD [Acrasis kona]|uniref:IspD n=1 Tax=Acrasis kona TaxID=1008807 RepID=A0AAW2Z4G0_9EUKA
MQLILRRGRISLCTRGILRNTFQPCVRCYGRYGDDPTNKSDHRGPKDGKNEKIPIDFYYHEVNRLEEDDYEPWWLRHNFKVFSFLIVVFFVMGAFKDVSDEEDKLKMKRRANEIREKEWIDDDFEKMRTLEVTNDNNKQTK